MLREDINWFKFAENRIKFWGIVGMVMNLRIP